MSKSTFSRYAATLAKPELDNLGQDYRNLPIGTHLIVIGNLEEKESMQGNGTRIVANLAVIDSDTAEKGSTAEMPFFINRAKHPLYEWARLRRFIDAALDLDEAERKAEIYASAIESGLDGELDGSFNGRALLCTVTVSKRNSKYQDMTYEAVEQKAEYLSAAKAIFKAAVPEPAAEQPAGKFDFSKLRKKA